jgi:haloalkane dehalogenase
LLHGYPTSGELWRGCVSYLAGRFRVYVPDLPGHGESDKPLNVSYDLRFLVQWLVGYLDALGLERVALAAHDLGGMAGLGFAAWHGQRLSHLVVLNTGPYARWSLGCRALVKMASTRAVARLMLRPTIFRWMMRLGVHRSGVVTRNVAELYRRHWIVTPQAREAFSAVLELPPERWVVPRPELQAIKVPTLVLWAERDRLFGAGTARKLTGDIPGAQLTLVPDCGHFLQEEEPLLVARAIGQFVERAGVSE